DVVAHRSLPPLAPPRASQSPLDAAAPPATPPPIASYQIIATKKILNPALPPGAVVDGDRGPPYLEGPPARQVSRYGIGDPIAGGRLESIGVDRVVIIRPQGRLEVVLQDPAEPRQ